MPTEFHSQCTRILSGLRPSATFLSVQHYINNFGEISNFSICFHVDYLNSLRRGLKILKDFTPTARDCVLKPYSPNHLKAAKYELIDSFDASLGGFNSAYTCPDTYEEVIEAHGNSIPGVKLHINQDILHLWGFVVHKIVLMNGNYPMDNRHLTTIAKDDLRARLPSGAYRQYKLAKGKFEKITVQQMTIREEDCIRERLNKISGVL